MISKTDTRTAREWHLIRRPEGRASADDFALVEAPVPEVGPGQVLVRNTHLSVDPYMRGRMDDRPSYLPPFAVGAPLEGGALGIVERSRVDGIEEGQIVQHFQGLREVAVVDGAWASPVDLDGLPPEVHLGALGTTGLTAWLGITRMVAVEPGDAVLVTGASGAVGGLAGQLARMRGADRVIGTAGSDVKLRHLVDDLGFDAAIDHHDADLPGRLAEAAPDGVDVVFDNVGGLVLEAAIGRLRVGARLALCGAVSQYDGREAYGVRTRCEATGARFNRGMRLVVLTGAGISAESGVPTFRDAGGLWEGHRVEDVATPEAFERDPDTVHRFYDARRHALAGVEPNGAHRALARLERTMGDDLLVVTQNVDDLHERAGSRRVLHMHGSLLTARCTTCDARSPVAADLIERPACPECGERMLRPDVVWFGEMPYDLDEIDEALLACDLFAAIGTSGAVYPAAGFVMTASSFGARTIELNLAASEITPLFEEVRHGPASVVVPAWADELLAARD